MQAQIPNLAGVATKDLVEKIGTGKYSAAYINWSRTMNLLRQHAPGWLVDYVPTEDGSLLHEAPVGAYLLIRFQNMETGAVTPALPQAVMNARNDAIPFDKITARDVTDTQRRGMCMAAAMHFGLAYELWAKLPMESGYSALDSAPDSAPKHAPVASQAAPLDGETTGGTTSVTEASFREAALEKGIHTVAIDKLVEIVNDKLGGNFAKGVEAVLAKNTDELNSKYGPAESNDGEQW